MPTPRWSQNALCWHHRYMAAQRARNIPFAPAPEYDAAVTDIAVNPSTANPPAAATTAAAINGDVIDVDAEEDGEDKKMVDATLDEGVYEIEKVINRRNNTSNIYRVRWEGYPPEEVSTEECAGRVEQLLLTLLHWLCCAGHLGARIDHRRWRAGGAR